LQDYLQSLHDYYENWLGSEENHSWHNNTPVLVSLYTTYFMSIYSYLFMQTIDANEDSTINKSLYTKHCESIMHKLRLGISQERSVHCLC